MFNLIFFYADIFHSFSLILFAGSLLSLLDFYYMARLNISARVTIIQRLHVCECVELYIRCIVYVDEMCVSVHLMYMCCKILCACMSARTRGATPFLCVWTS